MKKLFTLLLIFIVTTGFFHSKKDKALENCADYNFKNKYTKEYVSYFYDRDDPKVLGISRTIKIQQKAVDKLSQKHSDYLKKNYKIENSLAVVIIPKDLTTTEAKKSYENVIESQSLKLLDAWTEEAVFLRHEKKLLEEMKEYTAKKVFNKSSIKEKIEVNSYYKELSNCEKEHSEASKAFELKWID